MNHTSKNTTSGSGIGGMVNVDTTFVLFFLALEYGRGVSRFSIDGALMGTTMLMVLVLPYFLPSPYEKPSFTNWVAGRTVIALFGMLLGLVFRQSLGTVLSESLRFVPMMFLILTAIISCYVQFYGLMKLRLAK